MKKKNLKRLLKERTNKYNSLVLKYDELADMYIEVKIQLQAIDDFNDNIDRALKQENINE